MSNRSRANAGQITYRRLDSATFAANCNGRKSVPASPTSLASTTRRGWTVIELMASLSLAGLLAAAVLGVTADLARELAAVRQSMPYDSWKLVFSRQLQHEYQAARAVRVARNSFVLDGYFQNQPGVSGSGHGPSQIEYRIEQAEGALILSRIERQLGTGSAANHVQTSIVATGIQVFELRTRLDTDVPPGNLRLAIWSADDRDQPAIDIVLVRHGVAQ